MFAEFTDGIAVRKIPQGVKGRVEGRVESFARQNVEFAVYVWALVSLLAALAVLLWRPLSGATWLTALGAGCAWLFVWYAPIAVSIGALTNVVPLWGLLRTGSRPRTSTRGPSS